MNIHINTKKMPYYCEYCHRYFTAKRSLSLHQQITTYCLKIQKERGLQVCQLEYKCNCGSVFTANSSLTRHMKKCNGEPQELTDTNESDINRGDDLEELHSKDNNLDLLQGKDEIEENEADDTNGQDIDWKAKFQELQRVNQQLIKSVASKDEQLVEKETELEIATQARIRVEKLHASMSRSHHFFKFKIKGPCFYIITSGVRSADNVDRIKIGIAGCRKRKHIKTDEEEAKSIDMRLASHRTLWPGLQVCFLVHTPDARLLEQCIKRAYRNNINPTGHEIIENVDVRTVIQRAQIYLESFSICDKERTYKVDQEITKYNAVAKIIMKTNVPRIGYQADIQAKSNIPNTEFSNKSQPVINPMQSTVQNITINVSIPCSNPIPVIPDKSSQSSSS